MLKIHVAMYDAYLNYEIYYSFHKDKRLFDFKCYCALSADIVTRMREYSNTSQELLKMICRIQIYDKVSLG